MNNRIKQHLLIAGAIITLTRPCVGVYRCVIRFLGRDYDGVSDTVDGAEMQAYRHWEERVHLSKGAEA